MARRDVFQLRLPGANASLRVPLAWIEGVGVPLIPAAFIYRELLGCRRQCPGLKKERTAAECMLLALQGAVRPPGGKFSLANLSYPVGTPTQGHTVLSFAQALRALTRYDYVSTVARCTLRPPKPGIMCPHTAHQLTSKCAIAAQALAPSIEAVSLATALATQLELHSTPTFCLNSRGLSKRPMLVVPATNAFRTRRKDPDDGVWRINKKAHVLDALEITLPQMLPNVWRKGNTFLDVGSGGGETAGFLSHKYGVDITAYDVVLPERNKWVMRATRRHPVRVFNGRTLPNVADRSHDVVIFNSVLHHAAHNAPELIREAARIARHAIVLNEDINVSPELNPSAKFVRSRNKFHDRQGIFRTHPMWVAMLENDTGFAVTSVRAVHAYSVPNLTAYFQLHHIFGDRHPLDLSGPTFQRLFVAQRCGS